ncbi:hypothetical protein DVH24_002395 [Malus domestica]|uniref:TF-B3 domain-containing protein n=1 Tax=Malus domestica TaxID=3750 RepID=A0A498IN16_MALDO|nr:hypothetical protein DVH24_002395 [Malus domestica]
MRILVMILVMILLVLLKTSMMILMMILLKPHSLLHPTKEKQRRNLRCAKQGRTWAVKLKPCGKGRARFYNSWKNFVEENSLKIDDACIFVLIISFKPSFDIVFHCTAHKVAKSTFNN